LTARELKETCARGRRPPAPPRRGPSAPVPFLPGLPSATGTTVAMSSSATRTSDFVEQVVRVGATGTSTRRLRLLPSRPSPNRLLALTRARRVAVAGANDRGSVVLASLGSGRSSGPGGSPRRGGAWLPGSAAWKFGGWTSILSSWGSFDLDKCATAHVIPRKHVAWLHLL